jgi:hypothetical protein
MDAYLSDKAYRSLEALNIARSNQDGLLLGHLRGRRFFVEEIFPTKKEFFSNLEHYLSLNHHFENRIIGFFAFNPDERKARKILAPIGQGKLYLSLHPQEGGVLDIRPYRIDFQGQFYLCPIRLKPSIRK